MGRTLKILHYGLGPIGQGVARLVLETPGLKVVGATDVDPAIAGRDLGELLGQASKLRLRIEGQPERLLRRTQADVALLCTSSALAEVVGPLEELLRRGLNVITTCEELAFPLPSAARSVRALDELARRKHVSVLATGVNPGYAMDALALALTAPCSRVKRVSVTRVVDAGARRLPLQRKVGAGLTLPQFRRALTENSVRHVGLLQSAHMLASGLGFTLDKVEETLEPAVASRDLETEYLRIPAGCASGLKQGVRGYAGGELVVSLDLQMYVGAAPQRDHVLVDGTPTVDMTVAGGIPGDSATAALVVNSIPKLMAARPGFLTMRDLPLVHCFNSQEIAGLPLRKR
jgi:4-hydroxy-tetrahydrodipicolinate reductase